MVQEKVASYVLFFLPFLYVQPVQVGEALDLHVGRSSLPQIDEELRMKFEKNVVY